MRRQLVHALCLLSLGIGMLAFDPAPAAAGSRTFIGLNFGYAYAPYPYYYYPYYPPPVVYAPPPVVYAPPAPRVVNPASAPYVANNGQTCREYQSTTMIGGAMRPVYGTACARRNLAHRQLKPSGYAG